eukprot:scaffold810_cov355-Pavlova_lutheri.AAC.25
MGHDLERTDDAVLFTGGTRRPTRRIRTLAPLIPSQHAVAPTTPSSLRSVGEQVRLAWDPHPPFFGSKEHHVPFRPGSKFRVGFS